jgi:hypothetical protein
MGFFACWACIVVVSGAGLGKRGLVQTERFDDPSGRPAFSTGNLIAAAASFDSGDKRHVERGGQRRRTLREGERGRRNCERVREKEIIK